MPTFRPTWSDEGDGPIGPPASEPAILDSKAPPVTDLRDLEAVDLRDLEQPGKKHSVGEKALNAYRAFQKSKFQSGVGDTLKGTARGLDIATSGDFLSLSPPGTARPTMGEERAAFERSMLDPNYTFGDVTPEQAAKTEELYGPRRKLDMQRSQIDQYQADTRNLGAERQARLEKDSLLYEAGKRASDLAGKVYPTEPDIDGEFASKFAASLGSTVPSVGLGLIPGIGGFLAGAQYANSQGEQGAQEALDAGRPDAADMAYLANAGIGATTEWMLGVPPRLLSLARTSRLAKVLPEDFGKVFNTWKEVNPRKATAIESFIHETAQEALEQAGQDYIASDVAGYDPTRDPMKDVASSALYGGLSGLFIGGAGAHLEQRMRGQPQAQPQQPPPLPPYVPGQPLATENPTGQPIVIPGPTEAPGAIPGLGPSPAQQEAALAQPAPVAPTPTPAPEAVPPSILPGVAPEQSPAVPAAEPVAAEPAPAPADGAAPPDETPAVDLRTVRPPENQFATTTPLEGHEVTGHYEVRSAWAGIITSFDKLFNQALQPRTRSKQASQNQIQDIAVRNDPRRLGASAASDVGSPILNAEGMTMSGNGRMAALRIIYGSRDQAKADAYKAWLDRTAPTLGIDPKSYEGIKDPVLVRVVDDYNGMTETEFARQSNQQTVLGMSASENAASDARLLAAHPQLLNLFQPSDDGDVLAASNRPFLNAFIDMVGGHADLLAGDMGEYNEKALESRVLNAVLSTVLGTGNKHLLDSIIERGHRLGIARQSMGLMQSAPKLVELHGTQFDLGPALNQAMVDFMRWKKSGEKLFHWMNQPGFQADPSRTVASDHLLHWLVGTRSAKQVVEAINRYHADVQNTIAAAKQDDIFGHNEQATVTPQQLVTRNFQPPAAAAATSAVEGGRIEAGPPPSANANAASPQPSVSAQPRNSDTGVARLNRELNRLIATAKSGGLTQLAAERIRELTRQLGQLDFDFTKKAQEAKAAQNEAEQNKSDQEHFGKTFSQAEFKFIDGQRQQGADQAIYEEATGGPVPPNVFGSGRSLGGRLVGLAHTITQALLTIGHIDFRGLSVRTYADLATILQVVRDPRYETVRVFFVKAGKIIGQNLTTSRLPGAVRVDLPKLKALIYQRMTALGADGWYISHNHPSGISDPSPGDVEVTKILRRELGFLGHVVIDSNNYSVLTPNGRVLRLIKKDFGKNPIDDISLPHPLLGTEVQHLGQVADLADRARSPGNFVLVSHGVGNGIRAVMEVPLSALDDRTKVYAIIRRFAQVGSGTQVFALGVPFNPRLKAMAIEAMRTGVLDEVVFDDPTGKAFSASAFGWNRRDRRYYMGKVRTGAAIHAPEVPQGPPLLGAAAQEELDRKFSLRMAADDRLALEIRDATGNRKYQPIPNKATVTEALHYLDTHGHAAAFSAMIDKGNALDFRTRVTIGQAIIARGNQAYEANKLPADLERTVDVAEWLTEYGTELGQGVQAFAIWSRMTPAGMVMTYKRMVTRKNEATRRRGRDLIDEDGNINPDSHEGHQREMPVLPETDIKPEPPPAPGPLGSHQGIERVLPMHPPTVSPSLPPVVQPPITPLGSHRTAPQELALQPPTAFPTNPPMAPPSLGTPGAAPVVTGFGQGTFGASHGPAKPAPARGRRGATGTATPGAPRKWWRPRPVPMVKTNPALAHWIFVSTQAALRLPAGFKRQFAYATILAHMAKAVGVSKLDIGIGIWYAGILSGFRTEERNIVGNIGQILASFATHAAVRPGSIPSMIAGLYQGAIRGSLDAAAILKQGPAAASIGGKLTVPGTLELTDFKGIAAPLNGWKYVFRVMDAADMVFYRSAEEMKVRFTVRDIAKKTGLRGQALSRAVVATLAVTPAQIAAAKAQATAEGDTGLTWSRRWREIVEQNRPIALTQTGEQEGLYATMRQTPKGVIGVLVNHIAQACQPVPGIRAIVPFTKIIGNFLNNNLDYTPWGYRRLFPGITMESWIDPGAAPIEYQLQAARATLGTVALSGLLALFYAYKDDDDPPIDITGAGPDNPQQRAQKMLSGWQPFSVKIGGRWWRYTDSPLAFQLAYIGALRDAERYKKLGERDTVTRAYYALTQIGPAIASISFLRSAADFFKSITDTHVPSTGSQKAFVFTSNLIGGVIPQAFKDLGDVFDDTKYDAGTIRGALLRNIPIAKSFSGLQPEINVLGEPVHKSLGAFEGPPAQDDLWALLGKRDLFISTPPKDMILGDRTIEPEEYYDFVQARGEGIRRRLDAQSVLLEILPIDKAKALVEKIEREETIKTKVHMFGHLSKSRIPL